MPDDVSEWRDYRFYIHHPGKVSEFLIDYRLKGAKRAKELAERLTISYGAKVTFEELKK